MNPKDISGHCLQYLFELCSQAINFYGFNFQPPIGLSETTAVDRDQAFGKTSAENIRRRIS